MRELQLTGSASGLDDVFAEIVTIAGDCRFTDCRHLTEPGCAVLAAIDRGELESDRLRRYRKLVSENARNEATLAEHRAHDRAFGVMVKRITKSKRLRKKAEQPLR
jgi:ribosome biogenesis GTPase